MAYATTDHLTTLGLPSAAISGTDVPTQAAHLDAASAKADSYLRKKHELPLASWGADLVQVVVALASWTLMVRRGFDPNDPADKAVRMAYEDAMKWLEQVSKGEVALDATIDADPSVSAEAADAASETAQDWNI